MCVNNRPYYEAEGNVPNRVCIKTTEEGMIKSDGQNLDGALKNGQDLCAQRRKGIPGSGNSKYEQKLAIMNSSVHV